MSRIPLDLWIRNFDEGRYDDPALRVQIEAGWYDWFCKDTSLASRLARLAPKVKQIAKSPKIDPTKTYVWFKNNCPMVGGLYDDFRIANLATGYTEYCIVPRSGHESVKGRAEVWSPLNGWNGEEVKGTWRDVRDYFGV